MKKRVTEKPYDAPAYLVRFWRDGPAEPWRALAKRIADGHEVYFAGPEELFLYLRGQIREEGDESDSSNPTTLSGGGRIHSPAPQQ